MDFEKALKQVAKSYEEEGYLVVTHPDNDHLPPFAADYAVDILAMRNGDNVIAQVKQNRSDLEKDLKIVSLAEIVNRQPGWRFDLHVLEADEPLRRVARFAGEPTEEQIEQMLKQAEAMLLGVPIPENVKKSTPGIDETLRQHAFLHAWAALEAAMRHASHAENGNGKSELNPTVLIRELYANGVITLPEFHLIEANRQMRNSIIHGFGPIVVHLNQVESLTALARKLLSEDAAVGA